MWKSRGKFFYGYVIVAAGFGIWLIGFGTQTTFGIFFKPMLMEFGWSRSETVFAYSLNTFLMSVLSIMTGWLTDRIGPRSVVMVLGSFLGISFALMAGIESQWQYILIYGIFASIGMSTTSAPVMATVARWFVDRRGLMTGVVQAGLGIGGLIFAPLTGWLIVHYGWRRSYTLIGIIALAGFFLFGWFLKRNPESREPETDVSTESVGPRGADRNHLRQNMGISLREAVLTRAFWIIAGLHFGFGFTRSTFLAHTGAHVQDVGFSLIDGANVLAAISVSSIAGRIGMGRVADLIGTRGAFMVSYIATAVAMIWGLLTRDLWGLYLFAFIFGFGWGAQAVLRFTVTAELFGLLSIGLLMGVLGIAEAFAAAFGSYYAGHLFDSFGNYGPAFWMGLVISAVSILLAALLRQQPVSVKDTRYTG